MPTKSPTISPCLWFDGEAEQAAQYYTSIFKNSKIGRISRYGKAGFEVHHQPEGKVMTVEFELNGLPFTALNGGPDFKFNEAVSLQVICDSQAEVDQYWEKLTAGGDEKAQVCGWLKDKFGVSWQVFPQVLTEWASEPTEAGQRAFSAMLKMKKIDLQVIKQAYEGTGPAGDAVRSLQSESDSSRPSGQTGARP